MPASQTTPPSHLSPTSESTFPGDPDEDWLLSMFGALMWDALVAFAVDPGYFEEICLAAAEVDARTCDLCGRASATGPGATQHRRSCERRLNGPRGR